MKRTLVLGATPDSSRYAYLASNKLVRNGHEIINVGIKKGEVAGVPIEKPETIHEDVDTITLYVGPQNQAPLYDYILNTNPKRIIFNPGAENPELEGIEGYVAESGEARWTLETARDMNIPLPSIQASFDVRLASQKGETSFATKLLAAMRNKFGGHAINQEKDS